ncbi:MAG TPA: ABC transporter permease [bacterium]|nr:ABC transporter permease [bacterium]
MRFLRYAARRFLFLIPQLFVVSVIVFFLVRLLPGDPAYLMAGQFATKDQIDQIRTTMGLDKPLYEQYALYVQHVLRGDFGMSWRSSHPVIDDIKQRFPATMELVLLTGCISVVLGIPIGVYTAVARKGVADRGLFIYGMLAGSIPDFWLGLILILIFFAFLGWLPGPIGQLDPSMEIPPRITGMIALDALLSGQWAVFQSAVAHLVLPVATLTLVYSTLIIKNTRTTVEEMLKSDFVEYGRALGLSSLTLLRYALRNALPPVVTVVGILFWFLLGAAVLVETVFAWGGLGQYAVESVVSSDYAPVQAFVLLAAVFTTVVFLLVDLAYFAIDPRIKT